MSPSRPPATSPQPAASQHALIVAESMFGNTERVARAVADELARSMEVDLREVSQAPAAILAPKRIGADDLDRCRALGATMAAGLALGIF